MSDERVHAADPRRRKLVILTLLALAVGVAVFLRWAVGLEPGLALLVFMAGILTAIYALLLWERMAEPHGELVTKAERTRRYRTVFPIWQSVLLRGVLFAVMISLLQDDETFKSFRQAGLAMLVAIGVGLVFGALMEWISRWNDDAPDNETAKPY